MGVQLSLSAQVQFYFAPEYQSNRFHIVMMVSVHFWSYSALLNGFTVIFFFFNVALMLV